MAKKTPAEKKAAEAEKAANEKAQKETAKHLESTKKEGVYRADMGEALPGPNDDDE